MPLHDDMVSIRAAISNIAGSQLGVQRKIEIMRRIKSGVAHVILALKDSELAQRVTQDSINSAISAAILGIDETQEP